MGPDDSQSLRNIYRLAPELRYVNAAAGRGLLPTTDVYVVSRDSDNDIVMIREIY